MQKSFNRFRAGVLVLVAAACASVAITSVLAEDAAITRGLDWLHAQVQANGSLSSEADSLAITEQTRTEAAHTLAQGGRTAALPNLAPSEFSDLSTELLARRMIAQGATGQGAEAVLPFLVERANEDGGYGSAVGQPSNPLDTSLALLAMRAGGLTRDARTQAALGFLDMAANADGSYSLGQTTYATAYALQAFSRYRNDYVLSSLIARTRVALLSQQTSTGYADAIDNAVATIALAQSGAVADVAPAVTALRNSQQSNGSWQDDPYVTAIALRALLVANTAPSTNAGQIVGEVYDATSGLPLGQAQINLSGVATSALSSASNGGFILEGVPAGNYTVTIQHAGYDTYTGAARVDGGVSTNIGRISLALTDNTATLRGHVIDAGTQAALAGVTVQVTGAVTTQTQTNAQGQYELLGLPAGNYTIAFTQPGYQQLTQMADLPAKTAVTFSPALTAVGDPVPATATVSGLVVKAADGAPLAGAQIYLNGQTAISGADGSFQLAGLSAGAFTGDVQASGFDSVSLTGVLANGANDAGRIALTETQSNTRRTLIGTITSTANSEPIVGATLTLNGAAAGMTDASGQYRIDDTQSADVVLTIDAAGFQSRTATTRLENPGIYRLDAALDDLQQGTFQVLNLRTSPSSVLPNETMRITADIANLTDVAKPAMVLVRILDNDGKKVAQICGGETAGAAEQCEFEFDAKQTKNFFADWLVPNLPAGAYTLAIHVVQPGSMQADSPLGLIYGSGTRSIQIKTTLGLQGIVVPSPPVMIPGSPAGVTFTSMVQNKGNDTIPAGQARLSVLDRAGGATAFIATVDLPELLPNGIAELDFGNWKPTAAGAQYDLRVVATDANVGGAATGEFYVGDAASGEFTVTPTETGDGTQRVQATLTVKGIDNPTGQAADPLFTLVRQAVTRGGAYTATNAINWQRSHRCLGCHIQTQSLYGLASSLSKADVSEAAAVFMQNSQSGTIQADESIYYSHPQHKVTSSTLGLWSMATWPKTEETFQARYRVANFLYTRRTANANGVYWWYDHPTGWIAENAASTATAVEGLASVLRDSARLGISQTHKYQRSGRNVSGALADFTGGPDGLLYLLHSDGRILQHNPSTQLSTLFATAKLGTDYTSIAVADDGSVYVASTPKSGQSPVLEKVTPTNNTAVATMSFGAQSIDVTPNNQVVALNRVGRSVFLIDPAAGTSRQVSALGMIPTQAISVAAADDGSLVVIGSDNVSSDGAIRIALDGTQTRVFDGNLYQMDDVVYDGTGNSVAVGAAGIFEIYPSGVTELITDGVAGFNKVARVGSQLFALNRGAAQFFQYKLINTDITARLAEMRVAVEQSARYFETYPNYGIPNQAFRLILLAEARPFITDAALAAKVDARIPELAAELRAAQNANGGWRHSAGYQPDPHVTSIVGTALDYTNPLPTDPVLRKTVQFLLTQQSSDGSWNGVYFGTRLGSTSYVMAYLPKAVARLGGIDVGLGLEFGPDVKLVNSSVTPTSSVLGADGSSSYLFGLGRISGSGATFNFTLDLIGMKIDEWRKIATKAFLRFINSFTGEIVEAPIAVPTVHAASMYQLSLALNNNVFYANETVLVQPTVRNNGSSFTSGSLRYFIETSEGAPVTELSVVAFNDLLANTQRILPQPWGTGTRAAGDYRARVVLLSPEGQVWGEAIEPFRILTTSTGAQLSSSVATDHPAYDPFDTVSILGKVRNLTLNSNFEQLTVSEVVTNSNRTTTFETDWSIELLAASSTQSRTLPFNLVAAPAGTYTVTQTVRAADGAVLDVQVTHFDVRPSTNSGAGLSGTVAAVPPTVAQGEATSLVASVKNEGNVDLQQLPVVLSVIDPATETVLATWTQAIDLPIGQSFGFSQAWVTTGIPVGDYQVVLQAIVNNGAITLAYGPVTVVVPPIKVDISLANAARGRVLVLMTCRIGNGNAEDQACTNERASYVDAMLTRLGFSHTVVTTTDGFAREYATGRYDTYWISGGAQKLANTFAEEIREAVFQGDGLLVDGNHDARNQILDDALGVKFVGQLSGNAHYNQMLPGTEFDVGRFDARGDALNYSAVGAVVRGRFDSLSGTPSYLSNAYGEGRSAVAGFDLVAALTNANSKAQAEALLVKTLAHVLPEVTDYALGGGYAVLRATVSNQAMAVDLLLTSTVVAPLKVEDARPSAETLTPTMAQWRFLLAEAEVRRFDLGLRLPNTAGVYYVDTALRVASNSTGSPLQAARTPIYVATAQTLSTSLIDDLNAVTVSASAERNARTRVIQLLQQALAETAAGDRDAAVATLLKALDELKKIQSIDIAPYHVQISELVKAARVSSLP